MRKLEFNDVFKMSKILSKLEIKLLTKGKTQEQFGYEFIQCISENLHKAQKEINDFLGSLFGMTGEAFGELDIDEVLKYVEEFKSIGKEKLESFFKSAGRLTK